MATPTKKLHTRAKILRPGLTVQVATIEGRGVESAADLTHAVAGSPKARDEASTINLHRLRSVESVEVLASDLGQLESFVSDENQALGYFTFMVGTLVSAFIQLISLGSTTDNQKLIFGVVLSVLLLLSGWFGTTWWRRKRERRSLISRITNRPDKAPGQPERE